MDDIRFCPVCREPIKSKRATTCSRSCGARSWQKNGHERAVRVPDAVVKAAVDDINGGLPWNAAMRKHGITQGTIEKRAARRGWKLRRGDYRVRKPRTVRTDVPEPVRAYLAAMIDGEGTITLVQKDLIRPVVSGKVWVFNTCVPLMDWLVEHVGGRYAARRSINSLGTKQGYAWTVATRADVIAVLELARPYMIIKANKADELLAALAATDDPSGARAFINAQVGA